MFCQTFCICFFISISSCNYVVILYFCIIFHILIEILNENMKNLKNWFEIWISKCNNFIIDAKKVKLICKIDKCNFWKFSKIKNDSDIDLRLSKLKILSKNWLIFWLKYWCYHWKKKKNRFIKVNKHVFELFFEQKKWLHDQMLNDFQIKYWTIF